MGYHIQWTLHSLPWIQKDIGMNTPHVCFHLNCYSNRCYPQIKMWSEKPDFRLNDILISDNHFTCHILSSLRVYLFKNCARLCVCVHVWRAGCLFVYYINSMMYKPNTIRWVRDLQNRLRISSDLDLIFESRHCFFFPPFFFHQVCVEMV